MVKRIGLAVMVTLALVMQACTPSQFVADLSAVVDAASVVVAFVPSLPPQTKAEIGKYLKAIAQAASEASVILASGKTDAATIARIVELFARISLTVSTGLPPQVAAALDAVAAAVSAFLGQLEPVRARVAVNHQAAIRLNRADRSTLDQINTKAAQVVMDLQKAGF